MSVHVGKNIKTEYFKYTYTTWTQPVLTSNTSDTSFQLIDPKLSGGTIDDTTKIMTWGTASVTRFTDLYKSFNSSTTDYFTLNNGSRTFTVFDILFSTKMSISACTITGNVVSGQASSLTGSQIYSVDSSGKATLLSTSTSSNTNNHTINNVVTNRLRICMRPNTDGNSYPSRITNITITAKKVSGTTSGTASDYDYTVYNDGKASVHLGSLIRYVDYVNLYGDWIRPNLTANGTISEGNFAVNTDSIFNGDYNAYKAVNGNTTSTNDCWASGTNGFPHWFEFYSSDTIKITKLTIMNRIYTATYANIGDYDIQISENGSDWKTIYSGSNSNNTSGSSWDINLSNVQNATSKYWRIYIKSRLGNDNYVTIGELKITAKAYLGESLASNVPTSVPYPKYLEQYTKVGSPQISNDGILSNLSSSNYLTFPSVGNNDIKECVIKFTTSSDITTKQALFFGTRADNSTSLYIQNGKVMLSDKTYGSAMSAKNPNLPALVANTVYYLKIVTTGNNVTMSLKKGTENWITGDVVTKSHNFGNYIGYGIHNDDGSVAKCTYDLKDFYINLTNLILLRSYYTKITSTEPFKKLHEGKINYIYKNNQMLYGIFKALTFNPSDELQEWIVPKGVSKIHVDCVASQGYTHNSRLGGNGGRVECDLNVTSGQKLYFMVGLTPTTVKEAIYNASDIRLGGIELTNRIIVAGGGGNGNASGTGGGGNGGAGGGLTGGSGAGVGYQTQSTGGTQTEGGIASARSGGNTDGWYPGSNGSFGLGGNGGSAGGGAGGAGYYGGGGGSVYDINKVGVTYAPGGGGSSYTNATYCTNVKHTQGYKTGAGYIKITII